MHYLTILLTKANDRDEALMKTHNFMDKEGDVYDWYKIGGRWSHFLNEVKLNIFWDHAKKITNEKQLESMWKDIGGVGLHPKTEPHKIPFDGNEDDVMPLPDCLNTIIEYDKQEKGNCDSDLFSLDSHLYNIDDLNHLIPEQVDNWWATVVDLHQ